jgi:SAM-dependent methyltransferase
MIAPHPTRIVRLQLIGTLLGVSIPFAIEALVTRYSFPMLLATIGFLLTSLNFFHGKVVTLEDDDYNNALTDRPVLALVDYVLNLTVVLSFVLMAFYLDRPTPLIAANLIVRIVDIPLVLLIMNVASRAEVIKANRFWLRFNISTIIVFIAVGLLFYGIQIYQLVVSITFLVIIVIDISLDYTLNRGLYFSMADSWDDMAQFWDSMQGEDGDIFRRAVIIPAIKKALRGINCSRVLDVGCGNGCIARALASTGAAVTAIDKSEAHLKFARSYNTPGVIYKAVDLDGPTMQFEEKFDVAVACFTLQDCKELGQPLQTIAENLKPGGLLIVIRDNDESFENIVGHSTTRRWLGSEKFNGRGRRQLVFWQPQAIRIGRGGDLGSEAQEIACEWTTGYKTITRYWNDQSYIYAAKKAGLVFICSEEKLQIDTGAGVQETLHLARYRKRPRLGSLIFKNPGVFTSAHKTVES